MGGHRATAELSLPAKSSQSFQRCTFVTGSEQCAQSPRSTRTPELLPVHTAQVELTGYPTWRQLQVLTFITHYFDARHLPPSLREIGAHMGIRSTNGVNDHLRALERKRCIERYDMTSRGIVVTPLGKALVARYEHRLRTMGPTSFAGRIVP